MATTIDFARRALVDYGKTPRGKANLYLLLLGLVATILSAVFVTRQEPSAPHPILEVCLTLAATFLAVGIVEMSAKIFEGLAREPHRDKFVAFFGQSAVTAPYMAVFSQATLIGKLEYPHSATTVEHAYPKGILHTIPYEEVAPIAALDRVFRTFGGSLKICVDTYSRDRDPIPKAGLLSIGLGFNNVTTALSFESKKLFEIKYVSLLSKDRNDNCPEAEDCRTDDFVINLKRGNDKETVRPAEIVGPERDYALIARIFKDSHPYVICAGRTAYGTASALEYLAESWMDLLDQYPTGYLSRKNMVAVISHPPERREKGEVAMLYFSSPGGDTESRAPNQPT
jgi:hypothetical protein